MLPAREVYMNRQGWVSASLALGATHQALSPGIPAGANQQVQPGSGSRSHSVQSEPTDLCAALRARYSLPPPPRRPIRIKAKAGLAKLAQRPARPMA